MDGMDRRKGEEEEGRKEEGTDRETGRRADGWMDRRTDIGR